MITELYSQAEGGNINPQKANDMMHLKRENTTSFAFPYNTLNMLFSNCLHAITSEPNMHKSELIMSIYRNKLNK